ncbi:MAG: hypothetical protein PVI78_00240 [Anaerolineales bacterium]|jgi:hypothetical protein
MTASLILGILALLCIVVAGIYAIRMTHELRARGLPANPLFIRWMIFRYIAEYRRVTLEETGRVGPLYTPCTTFFGIGAVFAIATLISLAF